MYMILLKLKRMYDIKKHTLLKTKSPYRIYKKIYNFYNSKKHLNYFSFHEGAKRAKQHKLY